MIVAAVSLGMWQMEPGVDHGGDFEQVGQTDHHVQLKALRGPLGKSDGPGLTALNSIPDLPGEQRKGLLPGDPRPFSFAPLPDPLQRVLETVRVGEPFHLGDPLGANSPPVERRIRVSLHADDLSVFHMDEEPAPPMVHPGTKCFNDHI